MRLTSEERMRIRLDRAADRESARIKAGGRPIRPYVNRLRAARRANKYRKENLIKTLDLVRAAKAQVKKHLPPPLEKNCRPRPEDGKCEACYEVRKLVMDHDHVHETFPGSGIGQFRGWICDLCNRGIGFLGDTGDSVQLAMDYMNFHAPR
jgi:hypothetical protein